MASDSVLKFQFYTSMVAWFVTQIAELKPKDLTMVLTLSANVLDVIFLPGTWNGFETASTYAAWNLLKNWTQIRTTVRCHVKEFRICYVLNVYARQNQNWLNLMFFFRKEIVVNNIVCEKECIKPSITQRGITKDIGV